MATSFYLNGFPVEKAGIEYCALRIRKAVRPLRHVGSLRRPPRDWSSVVETDFTGGPAADDGLSLSASRVR